MKSSPQKMGGIARARRLAPARRAEIARRAARARWRKIDPRAILRDATVLGDFCRRHGITSLHAFGSVLTKTFTDSSDVDLLYERPQSFGYFEYCDAVEELEKLLGRKVDLVNLAVVALSKNPFRKLEILRSARKIYDASE